MSKKLNKTERARQLALQHKDMDYLPLKHKIKESVPCGATTAHNAIRWMEQQTSKGAEAEGEEPRLEIEEEKPRKDLRPQLDKLPEEIPSELPAARAEEPLEEIEQVPEVPEGEILIFRDMLRANYCLFLSKEGLLGDKYGNSVDACVQVADATYRYLERRYGREALEKGNFGMVVVANIGLIGTPASVWWRERQKAVEAKKKKEKKA